MYNCYIFKRGVGCWWGGGSLAVCWVQVLSSLSIHREMQNLLMPSQLNFSTVLALCKGYCLHLSLFCTNSFQNEVSGLLLLPLSAHIGLWSIWGFITEPWLIITLSRAVTLFVREQCDCNARNTQKSSLTWERAALSRYKGRKTFYLTSLCVDFLLFAFSCMIA